MHVTNHWQRIAIDRIEDLSDAVDGAGLEATQMTTGSISGSLIHCESDGILFSSRWIDAFIAARLLHLKSPRASLHVHFSRLPGLLESVSLLVAKRDNY